MVGKEVAFASPMSFIVARGLSAPHALTRTYSTMRSSSGKRTVGGRTDADGVPRLFAQCCAAPPSVNVR